MCRSRRDRAHTHELCAQGGPLPRRRLCILSPTSDPTGTRRANGLRISPKRLRFGSTPYCGCRGACAKRRASPPPAQRGAKASHGRRSPRHCAHKRRYFAWRWPANDDADLRRIISDHPADAKPASATPCLRRKRAQLRPHLGRRPPLRETMARSQYLCLRAAETLW